MLAVCIIYSRSKFVKRNGPERIQLNVEVIVLLCTVYLGSLLFYYKLLENVKMCAYIYNAATIFDRCVCQHSGALDRRLTFREDARNACESRMILLY